MSEQLNILKTYWGYRSFRSIQDDVIKSVLNGRDTLALMPTGGGKSICFQVPALMKNGICIVISPLISLIKDQVASLHKRDIKALAVYSGMTKNEIDYTLDNAIYGDYKFLYVSPERLSTSIFKERVKKMNISLLVVDEAHCISQWGYDFRPAYLGINDIKPFIGDVPTLALTATATLQVADDIMNVLNFSQKNVLASGFERKNLSYVVRNTDDKLGNILKICSAVNGTGIIYVRERKKTEELANFLKSNNISADEYHGGLSKDLRSQKQDCWMSNQTRIMVATNAFGMGIDKPDVRFVIHYDMPDSLEAYFQEAGRGGRDGNRSYATLLWNNSDIKRLRQIHTISYPSIEYIRDIYQKIFIYLGIPYEEGEGRVSKFNLVEFSKKFALNSVSAYYAIKYIEQEGYWELTDEVDNPSKVIFNVTRDSLYKIQVDNPNLDTFIKSLLRIYTGLFNKLVPIDEEYIARLTKDTAIGVKSKLKELAIRKIIRYIPRLRSPLIILNNERLVDSNLYISAKRYLERKEQFKKRIESVISYSINVTDCRSKLLIEYFGQPVGNEYCGVCDNCIKLKQKSNIDLARENAVINILNYLDLNYESSLQEIEILGGEEYEFYITVLRELIDSNMVILKDNKVFRK